MLLDGFDIHVTWKIIRIHHECEGGIEKSVLRITDWHHGACRVMTNDDHEGHIFSWPHLYTNNRFELVWVYAIIRIHHECEGRI